MEHILTDVTTSMDAVVEEWIQKEYLKPGDVFVVGCSTSEVAGEHIGTSGSEQVASHIFTSLQKLQEQTGVHIAFQCCEHLNRGIVMTREAAEKFGYTEVSVIPARDAGGSMATHAYNQLENPVVVEEIEARAGIDIGETMIGMHLKKVAVPLRMKQTHIASARITAAFTRPKLIGGERAVYRLK
ncbi:MAG TPA: TIGR01440 family protein [Bacillota bacterium]|nr:TIGR01440 family protein [Bacillota bacterium]